MLILKTVAQQFLPWLLLAAFSANAQERPGTPATPAVDARTMTVAVAISDRQHRPVPNLKAEDLVVLEDNQPQQITSVRSSEAPACIGLLVDSSGSMRHKRGQVIPALMGMVETFNSADRVFVVNFNDNAILDQDFTGNRELIRNGLDRAEARGGTALFDAVVAAADHMGKALDCNKRVLVVVTDGEDNSSRESLQQAIDANHDVLSPIIYAIGLPNEPAPSHRSKDRRALEQLTSSTGGALFYTGNLKDLDKITLKVAAEIQGLYLVSYSRTNPVFDATYRKIKVELQSPGYKDVELRARDGYYAGKLASVKSAADKPSSGPGCITGIVHDGNKNLVSGINVRVRSQASNTGIHEGTGRTNEMGMFRIENLEAGMYDLSTENRREGYPPTALSLYHSGLLPKVLVSPGKTCAQVAITPGPKAARLRLNVVDAATHQKLSSFSVILQKVNDLSSTLTLPSTGTYAVLLPALTDVTVQVQAQGYEKSELRSIAALSPDSSQELTIELKPEGNPGQGSSPPQ